VFRILQELPVADIGTHNDQFLLNFVNETIEKNGEVLTPTPSLRSLQFVPRAHIIYLHALLAIHYVENPNLLKSFIERLKTVLSEYYEKSGAGMDFGLRLIRALEILHEKILSASLIRLEKDRREP
jgi:hypothetical protein